MKQVWIQSAVYLKITTTNKNGKIVLQIFQYSPSFESGLVKNLLQKAVLYYILYSRHKSIILLSPNPLLLNLLLKFPGIWYSGFLTIILGTFKNSNYKSLMASNNCCLLKPLERESTLKDIYLSNINSIKLISKS